MSSDDSLPIDPLRDTVLETVERCPVVLSAPTGSGKSTRVPGWLRSRGRVLVVEPRRVAARSLAARVAELEGVTAGREVGWVVRDDVRANDRTEVVFVTPGIALRWAASGQLESFKTLVLDEFHERGMDLDLLLALQVRQHRRNRSSTDLMVMSATLAGDRIAAYLRGEHLQGEGRLFPVDIQYHNDRQIIPGTQGLESRVREALQKTLDAPGDVLVFLPGKGEITRVAAALHDIDAEVLPLHGGLTLSQQRQVFHPGKRRRIILSTNVAETSLTIPRIGVVLDSGLVRRTRYRNGRAHLTLLPIARDSADQRAGRAGRLGPGIAVRLWRADVRLDAHTPPELHREDLGQLVLAAAACGVPIGQLPFLDPPKGHAVEDATQRLVELGALSPSEGGLTERGRRLFGLPLDAHLGRLIIEAEQRGSLPLVLPLAAALSTSRPLIRRSARQGEAPEENDPILDARCDATALIHAVCAGRHGHPAVDAKALEEARAALRRFCRGLNFEISQLQSKPTINIAARRSLADTLLAAWPRCAHIRRRHGRRYGWANGGTELTLGRDSLVDQEEQETVLVLDSRAFTPKPRKDELVITAAMPVPARWLIAAGRGRDRVAEVRIDKKVPGRIVARIERIYAGRALETRDEIPKGALAREAITDLLIRGSLLRGFSKTLHHRHERASLALRLEGQEPLPPQRDWLLQRLDELGLKETDEFELLEEEDLLPDAVAAHLADRLARDFPAQVNVGDARYRCSYDVRRRVCVLHQIGGLRKEAPPVRMLPRISGWGIEWEHKNRIRRLR